MIEKDIDIKEMTTFGLSCKAKEMMRIKTEEDIITLADRYKEKEKIYILGGGSNSVFCEEEYNGMVAKIENKGVEKISEDDDKVIMEVSAGEVWKDFVIDCCKKGLSNIENLAAIPGTVGAAPVQNIGAYGQEAKDSIVSCLVFDMNTKTFSWIDNKDCHFDYRYSIFKYQKGNLIIWKVRFLLSKHFTINTSYKALKEEIDKVEDKNTITPSFVAKKVTEIRDKKLPDPRVLGNVGSFFKNPIIPQEQYEMIRQHYPNIVSFQAKDGVKISAGWLIEQCGYKGKRVGKVGMSERQALVMVNYGEATGKEIISFANAIIDSVKNMFNIQIQIEAHLVR
jgi:UDP-N-acetylmuramate dehydrogenase